MENTWVLDRRLILFRRCTCVSKAFALARDLRLTVVEPALAWSKTQVIQVQGLQRAYLIGIFARNEILRAEESRKGGGVKPDGGHGVGS